MTLQKAYYDPHESPCVDCWDKNTCKTKDKKETCTSWLHWKCNQDKKHLMVTLNDTKSTKK